MRTLRIAITAIAVTMLMASPARSVDVLTVGELADRCASPDDTLRSLCVGYVAGVFAGARDAVNSGITFILYTGPEVCAGSQDGQHLITFGTMTDAFTDWAEANPEQKQLKASKGIMLAMAAKWPCGES